MKTGFIVPVKYLEKFAVQSDFHLILPHIVEQSEKYKKFYMERIKEGDFVMLDNSIFELEVAYPKEKLLDTALEIGVQEMVVPEVLRSSHGSLEKVEDFFDYIANSHLPKHLRFAITVQGKSFREMIAYVSALLTSFEFHTLCVPFDIDCEIPGAPCFQSSTLQRVVNRIYFCEHLREKFPSLCSTKQVHLLGLADGVELQHYTLNCPDFLLLEVMIHLLLLYMVYMGLSIQKEDYLVKRL